MDSELLHTLLEDAFGTERVLVDEPMSLHTTFGVGGPASFMVFPRDIVEIQKALAAARSANAPWRVIGCGSNLLVADSGLRGLVICLGEQFAQVDIAGTLLAAQAGATNEQVAQAALEAGLTGYEFASGIPGSIGGAAFMNAGAYGGEFKNVASRIICLDEQAQVIEVDTVEADFGYRHSMMADRGLIILGATLQLVPWNKEQIAERMQDLKQQRESKQPLDMGSAGSTFKRPLGYYAGKLIDDAGMRGHARGGAQVSTKHCGFVVNTGHATAADVLAVIKDVQDAVLSSQGVHLETEVRLWGFDDDDEAR